MSGWPNARHSSGIEPFASQTTLPGMYFTNFPISTKFTRVGHAADIAGQGSKSDAPKAKTTPSGPKKPFYKRRGFIICQIITGIIGIAMIFILLWPVVHAIAQHVLDVSHLVIEESIIQSPSNNSFTVRVSFQFYMLILILNPVGYEWLRYEYWNNSRKNLLDRTRSSKLINFSLDIFSSFPGVLDARLRS